MPWDQVMHKFKHGGLKSGSGRPVTNRKQAVAIMLHEKREAASGKEEYQAKTPAKRGPRMQALHHVLRKK